MEHVLGLGGFFVRASDPARLIAWYRDVLGFALDEHGAFEQPASVIAVAAFDHETDYLGSPDQQAMVNLRVADLDAMLDQVRAAGTEVVGDVQEMDGVGRFAWVLDPEGRRVELWQAS